MASADPTPRVSTEKLTTETLEAFADDEGAHSPHDDPAPAPRLSFDRAEVSDPESVRKLRSTQIAEWRHLNHMRRAARMRRRKKDAGGLHAAFSDEDSLGIRRPRAKARKSKATIPSAGGNGVAALTLGGGKAGYRQALASLGARAATSLENSRRTAKGGPSLMEPDTTRGPQLIGAEDFQHMSLEDEARLPHSPRSAPEAASETSMHQSTKTRVAVYCIANAVDINRLYGDLTGHRIPKSLQRGRRFNWLVHRDVSWEDEMVENGASHGDVLHSYTRAVTAYETDSDANTGTPGLPALARAPSGSVNASPSRGSHPSPVAPSLEWAFRESSARLDSVPEASAFDTVAHWVSQAMRPSEASPDASEAQRLLHDSDEGREDYGASEEYRVRTPEPRRSKANDAAAQRMKAFNGPRRSVHAYRNADMPRGPARSVVSYQNDASSPLESLGRDVFFFPYGGVVFWGFQEREEQLVLDFLGAYTRTEVTEEEFLQSRDNFDVMIGDKSGVFADIISIATDDAAERMAVSFALAQSASLFVFEVRVEQAIVVTKHIPEQMATSGHISMSASRVNKMIGSIFVLRAQINLHSDILDTPEYFWEADYWEPLYKAIIDYMDLPERVALLNSRLDILKELMDVLSTQNAERHASKLEWIVIWLIVVEVFLQVVDLIIRFFDGQM